MHLRPLLIACALVFSSQIQAVRAETIDCGSGDVQCLIAAIHQANADPRKTTIRLAGGVYLLTNVDNDTDGPNGLPSIVSPVTIKARSAATLERSSGAPVFRFLHVSVGGRLTLNGVTLKGGGDSFIATSTFEGGALFNAGGILRILNSLLENNSAYRGGALFNQEGVLAISDSTIARNWSGFSALFNVGGSVSLTRTVVEANVAIGGAGFHTEDGEVHISQSSFIRNVGTYEAGGLRVASGTATISRTTFARNEADAPAAIEVGSAVLTIRNSAFVDNVGGKSGVGGIRVQTFGTVHVTNTTFARNDSFSCFGKVIENLGRVTLSNSTFAGGVSEFPCGAVLFNAEGGTTRLRNTIIAHTHEEGVFTQDCVGTVVSRGNNLFGDPARCEITLQPSDLVGSAGLGPLTDDGKPGNGHFSLLPTSQAIDAGNDAACPSKDQIGQPRKPRCDIGAVEFR